MLVLAACTQTGPGPVAPSPATTGPARGGSIVFGIVGDVAALDPYSPRASDLTVALVRPIYPSLFRLDPDGTPQPYLAASVDREARRARVTLRRMSWSNGRALNARDVVASWRRADAPSGLSRIGGARAIGPREVVFHDVPTRLKLALATVAYVLPGGRVERRCGRHARSSCRVVSAGPWVVSRRVPGLEVVYRPNPSWTGSAAILDRVVVRSFEATEPLLAQLDDGRIDAAWMPATVNLPDRLDELGLEHAERLGWESVRLTFDLVRTTRAQRAAIVGAIDRAALDDGFARELGRVTDTLNPSPGPGGADGPWRDVPAGEEHTTESLSLGIPGGDELLYLLAGALRAQARDADLGLEPASIDHRTFYGDRRGLPVDAFLERRAGAPALGGDATARRTLRAFPLLHVASVLAWRPGVAGLAPNPTFDGPLWNLSEWSLDETR